MEHRSRAVYVRWNGLLKVVHCSCGYCEVFLSGTRAMYAFNHHRDLKEAGA